MRHMFGVSTSVSVLAALSIFPIAASEAAEGVSNERAVASSNELGYDAVVESKLHSIATKTARVIEDLPEKDRSNYSNIYSDSASRDVKIYWKGNVPASLTRDLHTQGLAGSVVLKQADYSHDELEAAVRRVVDPSASARSSVALLVGGNRLSSAARIVEAHPNEDGSGISLTVDRDSVSAAERTSKSTAGTVRLGASELPATISYGDAPISVDLRDGAAQGGGHVFRSPGVHRVFNGVSCTTAFTVAKPSGEYRVMTAAHCAKKYSDTDKDQISFMDGQYMGRVDTSRSQSDVSIFSTTFGMGPFVATEAAWKNSPQFEELVIRGAGPRREDPVVNGTITWLDGGLTGERGAGRIGSEGTCVTYTDNEWSQLVCELYVVKQVGAGAIAGQGDSGGPAYWRDQADPHTRKVVAQGVISGISGGTSRECPNNGHNNGRLCSEIALVANLGKAMTRLGLSNVVTLN